MEEKLIEEIVSKLLPYQVGHALQLNECLKIRKRTLDGSDTGTGKTYVTIAVSKMQNTRPFIICPKSVITSWIEVCKYFSVKPLGIANFEMIKNGYYYTENLEVVKCPFMDIIIKKEEDIEKEKDLANIDEKIAEIAIKNPTLDVNQIIKQIQDISLAQVKKETKNKKAKEVKDFVFYMPIETLVVVDEAHRCKNWKTSTSRLLLALHKNNVKMIMLSATIADKIECFKPFGIIFNFYNDGKKYTQWMKQKLQHHKYDMHGLDDLQKKLYVIHNALYPQYGSRLKISELGDLFPKNNILANCYYLENHEEVEKAYNEINKLLRELHEKQQNSCLLALLSYLRQKIEALKIPLFIDLAQEALDNKKSVVIFVNFNKTLQHLAKHFNTKSIIMGGQDIHERTQIIKDFQDNKTNIIILMIQAGGVGLSLHDLHGEHPRMSIISPSWSGQDMKQVFGRIHRAGSKTPAIQKIVYVAQTYEEEICKIILKKLQTIDAINNGDFDQPNIPKEELSQILDSQDKIPESKDLVDYSEPITTEEDQYDNSESEEEKIVVKPRKKYEVKSKGHL